MVKITLICVGGLKEEYFRKASAEYIKRLGSYCKLEIIEVAEQKLPKQPSKAQMEHSLALEAEEILSRIKERGAVFSLCIEGKQYGSSEFSALLDRKISQSNSQLYFIIGSSYGISESVKAISEKISMSTMTFPHQLARIMLLEQLYRSFCILNNIKYHK